MSIYEGKAKRVVPDGDDRVAIFFKDDATAFNGQKHAQFDGKGVLNSLITEKMFDYLAGKGVRTQHLGRVDERTLLGKKVQIIPLETVVRFKVAGSLQKRTGLPDGTMMSPPVVEFYYKRDDLGDPLLNDDHIAMLQLATVDELRELRHKALESALHLQSFFAGAGLDLVDLKFEFGRSKDGILLADEISPDTCRLRDLATGKSLDKDNFRQDKGDLLAGYREVLARIERALAN